MSSSTGLFYAIGAAITWGIVYAIDQRFLPGSSPFILLLIDSLLAVILFLPFVFLERRSAASLADTSENLWFALITALVLAAFANLLIYSSIKLAGPQGQTVFEVIYPFFALLFSYFAFRSRTANLYFIIGALLIFSGSIIIIVLA